MGCIRCGGCGNSLKDCTCPENLLMNTVNPLVGEIFHTGHQMGADQAPREMELPLLQKWSERITELLSSHAAVAAARSEWKAIETVDDVDGLDIGSTYLVSVEGFSDLVWVEEAAFIGPDKWLSERTDGHNNPIYLSEVGRVAAYMPMPQPYQRPSREGE